MTSIVVGVLMVFFTNGFMNGMLSQMLKNQISSSVSHILIHKKGFNDNKVIQSYIPDPTLVESVINNRSGIKSYSKKLISFGLLSSATNSSGVYINGVNPGKEKDVTKIKESIVKGTYLTENKRDLVIGKKLAEKLEVEVGDKVVAMANTPDGSIGAEMFRIAGIYKTFSSEFDKIYIYANKEITQKMLEVEGKEYEFAIICNDYKQADAVKVKLKSQLPDDYEVLSYIDLLPMIIFQIDMSKNWMWILNIIVGVALIFGIINTMLMSVYERIQEIGVLMSIGMKNIKIISMITLEAFILGVIGTVGGVLFSLLVMWPFYNSGINLALFSEGLNSFGVGAVIYPVLNIDDFAATLIILPIVSVLAALYPAYKAVKLEPIYAVRYV
jgi:ABC-type lipoprotein release transport system permease subunit